MKLLYAAALLVVSISSVLGHPQCLDFYPPFELPSDSQPFCDGYTDFGCCTHAENEAIQQQYKTLKKQLPSNAAAECRNFLKDILCQKCSPYAAHLFDAETTHQRTPLPGLCSEYCSSLYSVCPELIPLLTEDATVRDAFSAGETAFCEAVQITDMDYCYPNILEDSFLNDWAWESQTGGGEGCLCFEEFANGLRNPVLAVHANDHTHRLFIAEQVGVVHVYLRNGSQIDEPFLDIRDLVLTSNRKGDERGFLGLAFHPNFANNSRLFVYYSASLSSGDFIRISEYQVMSNDSNKVNVSTERIILDVEQPAGNHNGGQILFDQEGYMYAFLGDGGKGGDPFGEHGNAQNLQTLLGSVVRIDVDQQENGMQYAIPPDNPFVDYSNTTRRHEIFAYGTRNMWRCSIDRGDRETGYGAGRIFCGDVGQSSYEEVDIIVKGGNYGWRGKEGFACYDNSMCTDWLEDEVLPIHAYPHTVGKSVIGGYVYRGCQYPNLNGQYIFGDYVSGRLFQLTEDRDMGAWSSREVCLGDSTVCTGTMLGTYPKSILSFGEDEAGSLRCPKRCKGDWLDVSNTTYCDAKFVITGTVQKIQHFNNELRLTVRVNEIHKKAFSLPTISRRITISQFSRAARCRCPNLEVGQTYFILGSYRPAWQRFVLTESSIVRRYHWHHSFMVPQLNSECRILTMEQFTNKYT